MAFPGANIDQMSQFDANSSGLTQARGKKRTTGEVEKRRKQLLAHVLEKASEGNLLCVRALYESFREAVGASTEDMPQR
jgi:hypothetical protein